MARTKGLGVQAQVIKFFIYFSFTSDLILGHAVSKKPKYHLHESASENFQSSSTLDLESLKDDSENVMCPLCSKPFAQNEIEVIFLMENVTFINFRHILDACLKLLSNTNQ